MQPKGRLTAFTSPITINTSSLLGVLAARKGCEVLKQHDWKLRPVSAQQSAFPPLENPDPPKQHL
jgi:hypothetical protein